MTTEFVSICRKRHAGTGVTENMRDAFFLRLDRSLATKHESMSRLTNPVIKNIQAGTRCAAAIRRVLRQYCILPAQIVELLEIARSRSVGWKFITTEIDRNIREEQGSRTAGIPHYEILGAGLLREAGIEIAGTEFTAATLNFMQALKLALREESRSFALGLLYGLENSAVPELVVVATIINDFARLTGLANAPIDLVRQAETAKAIRFDHKYDLNTFFAMHLVDFEVGHKTGLIAAVKMQVNEEHRDYEPIQFEEFEAGFEYVLDQMDLWWDHLSNLGQADKFVI